MEKNSFIKNSNPNFNQNSFIDNDNSNNYTKINRNVNTEINAYPSTIKNSSNKQDDQNIPCKELKLDNNNFPFFSIANMYKRENVNLFDQRNLNFSQKSEKEILNNLSDFNSISLNENEEKKFYFEEIPLAMSITTSELNKKTDNILSGREVINQRTNRSPIANSFSKAQKRNREDLNKPFINSHQNAFTPQKIIKTDIVDSIESNQKSEKTFITSTKQDFKILKEIENSIKIKSSK